VSFQLDLFNLTITFLVYKPSSDRIFYNRFIYECCITDTASAYLTNLADLILERDAIAVSWILFTAVLGPLSVRWRINR